MILNIKVEFNLLNSGIRYENKDIIYYSNLNIDDIIKNKDKTTIPVKISDVCINLDKLSSVLSHEIRHIYDIYTVNDESDIKSFMNSMYYSELSKNESNEQFLNFLRLSLEYFYYEVCICCRQIYFRFEYLLITLIEYL